MSRATVSTQTCHFLARTVTPLENLPIRLVFRDAKQRLCGDNQTSDRFPVATPRAARGARNVHGSGLVIYA